MWVAVGALAVAAVESERRRDALDVAAARLDAIGIAALAALLLVLGPLLSTVLLVPTHLVALVAGLCIPLAQPDAQLPVYAWIAGVVLALWGSASVATAVAFHAAHDDGTTKMSCRLAKATTSR